MRARISLLIAIVLISGCSSYTITKYGVTPDNVTALRTVGGQRVNIGPFGATKAGQTSIGCRGVGPIKAPDGSTFEEYIRRAFIDEFKVADMLADSAPVTLTGNLDKLDFSSTSGKWTIDLTLTSSNGRTLTTNEVYDYETSFIGEKACALTAQAFTPAVQSLVGKVFRRPEFSDLLK
jgi:hypothetical protein